MDYISREAVIKAVCCGCNEQFGEEPCEPSECCVLFSVKTIHTADVQEVKRGKWLPDYDSAEYDFDGSTPLSEPRIFQDGWQCSLCGQYEPSETNFCPNCGAKMEV